MRAYTVFGTLRVDRDGTPVDLGSPKQRIVLAALVVARGRVVSTDALIDAVWGERPPPAALTSLQAYISNLRRVLRTPGDERSPIERVNPGYRLDTEGDQVDLLDFGQAVDRAQVAAREARWADAQRESEAALTISAGGLVEEIADEPWVALASVAVRESRYAVHDIHVTALLAAGDSARALVEIAALRADDPIRDRGVWLHMMALHRAGRSVEALEVYATHVGELGAELGLDPGTELRELQAAILRHDAAIDGWPRRPHWRGAATVEAPAEPAPTPSPAPGPTGETPLVGRAEECARLVALFDGGGRTRWAVIEGPAGIGKTRLAEEAARLARAAGEQVVWVRCPDAEGVPAWWPLRQLCAALGADVDEVLTVPGGVDADTARFVVYDRLHRLLTETSATAALTVVIDDIQWADPASLGLLTYLVGVLQDVPVAVVLTLRDDEAGGEVDRMRTAVIRSGGTVVTVPPLAPADIARLAAEISGSPVGTADSGELAAKTGGNPLFVTEFARLPAGRRTGQVPSAVRSVLDRRLRVLDPSVAEVMAHAAVIGDEIDTAVLAAVTGRDLDTIADCIDEAFDERILFPSPVHGRPVFAHALLRDAAAASISPLRRARIHLRCAERVSGTDEADVTARRAAHLLAAAPVAARSEVIRACRVAADAAARRWDSENAAHWLAAALTFYETATGSETDVTERDRLLVDLLDALSRAGRAQTVLEMVEVRLGEAIRTSSTATVGRLAGVLLRSGGSWPWMTPMAGPATLHDLLATAAVAVADDPAACARVLGVLAIGHCYHRDPRVPADHLRRADELGGDCADPDVVADVMLARLITYSGVADHLDESIEIATRLAATPHAQSAVDQVIVDSVLSMSLMIGGEVTAARRHLRQGIVGSERLRLPILRAQLRWMEATFAVWHGDHELARTHFRTAFTVHEQTELYVAGSGAIAMVALATEQGLLDEVVDSGDLDPVEWAKLMAAEFADNETAMLASSGVAMIAGRAGERELATTLVEAWLADDHPMMWTSLAHAVLLGHVVAELGLTAHADRFIEYLQPFRGLIATVGQLGCIGPVGLAVAELLDTVGRRDEALTVVDEVADLAARNAGHPAALRCRLLRARLVAGGAPAEAIAIADAADEMGLTQVAAAARAVAAGT